MALTQISTAGVKDDAVTAGKIPADAIGSSEIAANAVGSSELADNAVDNAAVASNAAIAGTKISPDFGSQNIVTTGSISGAAGTFTGDLTIPDKIVHTGDTDTAIRLGIDTVTVETAGSERLRVDSSGFVGIGMSPSAGGTGYMLQLDSGAAQTFMTFGNSGSGNGASNGLVVGNDTSRAYFTQRENQPIHIATNNVDRLVIDASGHLLPATDSSYDLGLTGTRWRYVYADAYYGDGSNLTGINTDLVSDTSPQLGGNLDTNSFEILLDDSHAVKFGDSNDLQIYHDGSHTRIDNETGGLFLRNNTGTYNGEPIKIQALSGENSIQCVPNGRVELYYDNSKKFETTSNGATCTGWLQGTQVYATDYIKVSDNDKIKLGNDDDLQIYHDGTTNIIEGLDGNMSIRPKTGENGILLRNNDAVELYHDDAKKIETTSYGTKVTGYKSQTSYVGFHVMGTNQDHGYGTNHGSGITTYDVDYYSPIPMWSNKTIDHGSSYLSFPSYAGGNYLKFTAPVAGLYQFELIASVESHHGGDWCQIGWEVNTTTNNNSSNFMNNNRGVSAVNQRAGDDTEMGCHHSTTIWLNENDYVVLYQQSTAAVRWRGNQYYARGHLIS